jgi:hypothetical protein
MSNISQVIRDSYSFKIGPEVILTARWHSKVNMTSPFDSSTPILCRRSVEMFCVSLIVEKLFVGIYLAGYVACWFQNLGSAVGFDPEM